MHLRRKTHLFQSIDCFREIYRRFNKNMRDAWTTPSYNAKASDAKAEAARIK